MNSEELLDLYLEKLSALCKEKMDEENLSVIEAVKASITYLVCEMQGY